MRLRARRDADEEAMRWVVRMHSDQVTRADQSGFTAWLAEDNAHSPAYDRLAAFWSDIATLRNDDSALASLSLVRDAQETLIGRRMPGAATG